MRRPESALALVVLFVLGLFFLYKTAPAPIQNVMEDISFALYPSAERAYTLGEKHFNATNANDYDVARAKRYFDIAAAKDPQLPAVYHELARIDFIRGNLVAALAKINFQIQQHGSALPNSYYIRGLIEGYMGEYALAAFDYERYLRHDPANWAAINDYAWVLLQGGRAQDAHEVLEPGLNHFPENPWLLNSESIALYRMGFPSDALMAVQKASRLAADVTESDWLQAYPGNDPRAAQEGIQTLRDSIAANMHMVETALASTTVQ